MRFKPTELATIIVAAIAFFGSIASAFYTYTARNRELDIELVKIGIGILRADPKETQTAGAREWAIRLVEGRSGQSFSDQAKKELLQNQLIYPSYIDYSEQFTPGRWEALPSGFGESGTCEGCKVFIPKQPRKQPQSK
jgi:hypothetical protein